MEQNPEVLNTQAIELASQGEYSEAIACFKSALRIEKENYLLWYNLGVTYRDAGDFKAAKESLLTAYKLNNDDEDILETLALVCYAQDNMVEALKWCDKALEINYANAHIWNTIGVFRFANGDYEAASEAFEQAVSIYPHYYDAIFNLRDTYIELKNQTGADECSEKLKSISNNGGNYHA